LADFRFLRRRVPLSEHGIRLRVARFSVFARAGELTIHIVMNFYSSLARARSLFSRVLAPTLTDNARDGGSVGLGNSRGNYTAKFPLRVRQIVGMKMRSRECRRPPAHNLYSAEMPSDYSSR